MNLKKLVEKIRKNNEKFILALMFLLLSTLFLRDFVAADGDWYSINWDFRKKVTINSSEVVSSQTDFPVLVNVTSTDFKNMWLGGHMGQLDGGDILFTANDGITKLSHEIEYYDYETGEIVAWVKIPSLSATVDTEIYLYYGNEGVADQWDIAGNVWTSDYAMVQHFGENCTEEGCYKDSTDPALGNHGTPYDGDNVTDLDVENSKIGRGLEFDGDMHYLNVGDADDLDLTDDFTIETWVKLSELNRYNGIFDKGDFSLRVNPDKKYVLSLHGDESTSSLSVAKQFNVDASITSFAIFGDELYLTLENNDAVTSQIYKTANGVEYTLVKDWGAGGETGGLTVFKGNLYVYYDNQIYETSSGTAYTSKYTASDNISSLVVFDNYLYAGTETSGKVFRSLSGDSWSLMDDFSDTEMEKVNSMVVYDGQIFVAGDKGEIFVSSDGTSFSSDRDFGNFTSVLTMNVFDKKLWAIVRDGSGVSSYYRDDSGVWTESNLP